MGEIIFAGPRLARGRTRGSRAVRATVGALSRVASHTPGEMAPSKRGLLLLSSSSSRKTRACFAERACAQVVFRLNTKGVEQHTSERGLLERERERERERVFSRFQDRARIRVSKVCRATWLGESARSLSSPTHTRESPSPRGKTFVSSLDARQAKSRPVVARARVVASPRGYVSHPNARKEPPTTLPLFKEEDVLRRRLGQEANFLSTSAPSSQRAFGPVDPLLPLGEGIEGRETRGEKALLPPPTLHRGVCVFSGSFSKEETKRVGFVFKNTKGLCLVSVARAFRRRRSW